MSKPQRRKRRNYDERARKRSKNAQKTQRSERKRSFNKFINYISAKINESKSRGELFYSGYLYTSRANTKKVKRHFEKLGYSFETADILKGYYITITWK